MAPAWSAAHSRGMKSYGLILSSASETAGPLVSGNFPTRANAVAGAPETREYMAQFFEKDSAVGQLSDTTAVTVPGVKTQTAGVATTTTVLAKAA